MKHSIRFRVIDLLVGKRVKTETIIGELESGILDKNGKKIFEGDFVKITFSDDNVAAEPVFFFTRAPSR